MSLAPESSWHWVDPVSMLQPPGGAVITPSQALGTTASSPKLLPKREIPEPGPLVLSVPAKLIHCTDGRQLLWIMDWCWGLLGLRLIHLSSIHHLCQALCWVLGGQHCKIKSQLLSSITEVGRARTQSSSDPVDCPHLPVSLFPISTRALPRFSSSGTSV